MAASMSSEANSVEAPRKRDVDHRHRGGLAVQQRRGVEVGADGAHVVGEDLAELVVGDLDQEGAAAAERGEARDGVGGRTA